MKYLRFTICLLLLSCVDKTHESTSKEAQKIEIQQLATSSFLHISYLNIENYGPFPCNGLIVFDNNEAVILDTPVDSISAIELISFVEDSLKKKIKAVVINHFHNDCLGGLNVFHGKGIQSYSSFKTIELAKKDGVEVPRNGFDSVLEIKVGVEVLVNQFFGEGHTPDNIINYGAKDKVLFGGCLIKERGSGRGNLADANIIEWPKTVEKVRTHFKEAEIVVPGHGKYGGIELLDYTIELFKNEH